MSALRHHTVGLNDWTWPALERGTHQNICPRNSVRTIELPLCEEGALDATREPPGMRPLSASSLLNDLGVPVKIAQEQLGHGSISALNIYTHVVDASHRAAVTGVEERLFGVMLRNAPKLADGWGASRP